MSALTARADFTQDYALSIGLIRGSNPNCVGTYI